MPGENLLKCWTGTVQSNIIELSYPKTAFNTPFSR